MSPAINDHDGIDANEGEIMSREKVQKATKIDIISYINDRTAEYEEHNLKGSALYEYWKADFEHFDVAAYKKTTEATRILRDFLLLNGVYVLKNRKPIAENLITIANSFIPWPSDLPNNSLKPLNESSAISTQTITESLDKNSNPPQQLLESKPFQK